MFPQSNIIYPLDMSQPQYHDQNYYHHHPRQNPSHNHTAYTRVHPHPPALQLHPGSVVPPSAQPPTPLDLSYSHSMIPSNLLVNSPYFQMPQSAVFQDQGGSVVSDSESDTDSSGSRGAINSHHQHQQHNHTQHYNRGPPVGYAYGGFGLQPPMSPMTSNPRISTPSNPNFHPSSSPYLTHINNSSYGASSVSNHNLDQLNLSRTVILKNLADDLTLNELLTQVDLGPIEYCKMFSKATPQHILDQDPDATPNLKVCYISFINSKISVQFHLKYFKNSHNLANFKTALKNSKYLKIQLNDTSSSNNPPGDYNSGSKSQDYIKLKTLNYILDFGATRCLLIKFSIKDVEVLPENVEVNDAIRTFIHTQCQKFGEVEDFKITLGSKKSEPINESSRTEGKVLVHFTSIDSAIKTYESYLRRIQNDKQRTLDAQDANGSSKRKSKGKKDENNVNVLFDIKFSSASFHKDRCDRSVAKQFPPQQSQKSRKKSSITNIPEEQLGYFADGETTAPGIAEELDNVDDEIDVGDVLGDSIAGEPDLLAKESSSSSVLDPSSPPLSLSSTSPIPESNHIHRHHQQQQASVPSFYSTSRRNSHPTFIPSSPMLSQNGYANPPRQAFEMQQPYLVPVQQSNPNYQINPDSFNVDNRTIYLGNLHPNTTIEEIANNVRAGGLVESIKYHPEKKVCFITFVDAQIALKFYLNHQVLHQLIVHGHDITVGWAKNHSGPINRDIALAVTAGASRNVYIGIKLVKDANGATINNKGTLKLPNEETLRADFSKFGELEQINFYHNKDCGFLNFLNIVDAIKLVETFEQSEEDARTRLRKVFSSSNSEEEVDPEIAAFADEFYDKYGAFKISFAKDRCGNPPKFSFKKKASNFSGSTYQQYQHLLHGSLSRRKGKHNKNHSGRGEYYDEETRMQEHDSFMEDTINQEAAMVFGIISNSEPKPIEPSDKEDSPKDNEQSVEDDSVPAAKEEELAISDLSIEDQDLKVVDDEGEDEDDDDDDDDVSIIIGSDETSSTTAQNSSSKDFPKKPREKSQGRNGHDRIYHSKFNTSDSMVSFKRSSRNSSNISLNSNYAKYSQPAPPPNHQAYKFSSSPYVQHQQMYYVASPGVAPPSGARGYSGYTHPLQGYVPSTPNPGYFPPQPQQYYMHSQTRQQHYHSSQGPQKSQYSTSGSQVMAQYLAKSQHDNLLYAASILSNDVGIEEDMEYDYMNTYRAPDSQQQYSKPRSRKARK